ncbi:MAG: HAMP domain-containing sensor histidine kinase [Aquificaceae bacterium]
MTLKLKLVTYLIGINTLSVLLIAIFTNIIVSRFLTAQFEEHIRRHALPFVEFYRDSYKNPSFYASLLAEDVVTREIASAVFDKEGKLIALSPSIEGYIKLPKDNFFARLKNGSLKDKDSIYVSIEFDGYILLLIGNLSRIKKIQNEIFVYSLMMIASVAVIFSSLSALLVERLLEPLNVLTRASRAIATGNIDISVDKTERDDELGLLQNSFSAMLNSLKGIIQWQMEFIKMITHSLKTPLTYIKGQSEILSKRKLEENTIRNTILEINQQATKMEKLINHLLTLLRLESKLPLKEQSFSINELFAQIEEDYEYIKRERNFRVEYTEEEVLIVADIEYLKLAIGNLIENSYKYTQEGGKIRLYFSNGCICVQDDGVGIENPEMIGTPFYREYHEKEGFGLGMSVVKAIAERSGLKIKIESKKGSGTKVTLCL